MMARGPIIAIRHIADQAAGRRCRDLRELTGHSPSELVRNIEEDEGYWLYRIWS